MAYGHSKKPLCQRCTHRLSPDPKGAATPFATRPHHSLLPQVAACVLLMVSLDLRSSDMEAWLLTTDPVRQVVDLSNVPDHPTVPFATRPHHSLLPQVAACVLLMVSLDLRSSDMEAWLLTTDPVRQVVDLSNVPDHPTVQRMHEGAHGGR